jgi:ACS family hexuronate transporter-like MFS transporter
MPTVSGLRWWIIGLVFLATLINFIDRLTVAILGPVIMEQLHLTNAQFGSITVWFLVAYTASQGFSGRLFDRIGAKRGFTLSVLVWSVAATAHAFARSLVDLRTLRVFLGLGEAGNWPGAAKVIAEWFPARERAFAMGIFNSGVAAGNIVAFPLVTWLQFAFGWKTTFLVTGALGFAWLLLWLVFYESPDRHPSLSAGELATITEGRPAVAPRIPWSALLEYRQTWGIVLARF